MTLSRDARHCPFWQRGLVQEAKSTLQSHLHFYETTLKANILSNRTVDVGTALRWKYIQQNILAATCAAALSTVPW
jgi:hypothetical protein